MSFIEKDVEEKLIAAFSSALSKAGVDLPCIGFFSSSLSGVPKTQKVSSLVVTVPPRENTHLNLPDVVLPVVVTICSASADDRQGKVFSSACEVVFNLLQSWNSPQNDDFVSALSGENFDACGFLFGQGGSLDFDTTANAWIANINLQIHGNAI